MRPSFSWLAIVLLACNGGNGGNDTGDDDSGDDTETGNNGDTDTDVNNNWSGDDNGYDAPVRAPDRVINGNLSQGSIQGDGSVASGGDLYWMQSGDYACGTNFGQSFSGAHVHYEHDQSPNTDLLVRVVPDQGLDVSVYALQRSQGSSAMPSNSTIVRAGGGECTAIYDDDGNPSQPEVVCVPATSAYNFSVLIAVAGAEGLTSGSYKVEIWEEPWTGCPP